MIDFNIIKRGKQMIGAIIGDLAGSIYEYNELSEIKPIKNIVKIIPENSFYSDDTILTIAIADAILNNANYGAKLKEYGIKHFILPVDDPLYTIKYTSFIIPNGFSESCSYTAREFRKICVNNYNNALNDVKNNLYKKDTIYIFKEADIDIPVNNKSVFYYKYGSHIILSPVELNSLK